MCTRSRSRTTGGSRSTSAADGTPARGVGRGRRAGARAGPRLDRRPHDVRPVRRRAAGDRPDDVLDGPPRLRCQRRRTRLRHRARLRGRRRRGRRRRGPHRRPGRAVGPLLRRQLRHGRRRAHRRRRTTSSSTSRASASATHRVDRGHRGRAGRGRRRRRHRGRADRHPRADRRRDRRHAGEPVVAVRLAAAPTVPGSAGWRRAGCTAPGSSTASRRPTLLLAGSDSMPGVTEATHRALAAIPDARVHVLEGHAHFAHKTDPAMVAAVIRNFAVP